jgi:hypothetical protein
MPRFSVTRVIAATAATGFCAAAALAQSPPVPACPDGQDEVTTFTQGYGKPGQTMVLRMQTDSDTITNASATVTAQDGSATTLPVELDLYGDATKIFVAAPAAGSAFTVTFAWDQDAGTSAACHGTDVYTDPLLPVDAVVGRPSAKRLQGRWRMRYRSISHPGQHVRTTWTLSPNCDYFGCDTRLRSGICAAPSSCGPMTATALRSPIPPPEPASSPAPPRA